MGKQVIFALDNIILVKIVLDKFQENCEKLFDTKEFVESGEENLESGLSFVVIEIFLNTRLDEPSLREPDFAQNWCPIG